MKTETILFNKDFTLFLEQSPLLTWKNISFPPLESDFHFDIQLELYCEKCNKSRPYKNTVYRNSGGGATGSSGTMANLPSNPSSGIRYYTFYCTSCNSNYDYWVYFDVAKARIRKLGQNPPWETSIDQDIKHFLKENIEFYKKGLICESQGYGIASFAYYRRVLENVINEILNLIISIETINQQEDIAEGIRNVLNKRNTEDKLLVVKEITPSFLSPGGTNPFKILYSILSEGIHNDSEEQCIEYAENIRTCLTFIIKTLSNTKKEIESFSESLRNITKRKK